MRVVLVIKRDVGDSAILWYRTRVADPMKLGVNGENDE